jgi:hypothetical protein
VISLSEYSRDFKRKEGTHAMPEKHETLPEHREHFSRQLLG